MAEKIRFSYRCMNASGQLIKGHINASDQQEALKELRAMKFKPLDLKRSFRFSFNFLKKDRSVTLKHKDLTSFTRQAAVLTDAGVPVAESIQVLIKQMKSQSTKKACQTIYSAISEGKTLTAAVPLAIKNISTDYVGSLKAAEESGQLGPIMLRLADYLEIRQQNREKIAAALSYPIIVAIISLSIVVGLLVYVVPQVVGVFEDMNQELPLMTRVLLDISEFMQKYGVYSFLGILVTVALMQRLLHIEAFRFAWQKFLIALPITGFLIKNANSLSFTRALALLIRSGTPALEALNISIDAVGLLPMKKDLKGASESLRRGSSIGSALKLDQWFAPIIQNLIISGEQSGRLASMLEHACTYQQRALDKRIATLMALLEPILILTMGLMVLFIVLSILLPIFQFNQTLG